MRIIFLNAWSGNKRAEILEFIQKNSANTDVFCLQEVNVDLLNDMSKILGNFSVFYEADKNISDAKAGQAIFVKDIYTSESSQKINFHVLDNENVGFLQFIEFSINNKTINLINVHGDSRPGDKLDTPSRINQSKTVLKFLEAKTGPKIIGGDWNLMPETESIQIFERSGYTNLISKFNIKSTRSKFSVEIAKKQATDETPFFGPQYFADFVFTSPEVNVTNFEVPNIEISDHLPLILDFKV